MALDPVVVEAMKSLSTCTNLNTGLAHPSDMERAKVTFILLRDARLPFSGDGIAAWANANGWQSDDAEELGELADKILRGVKVRTKRRPMWKADILDQWRERAATPSGDAEE